MNARRLRPLPALLAVLLTACATTPAPNKPAAPQLEAPKPEPVRNLAHPVSVPVAATDSANVWDQLRGSFAMADCDSDPGITTWARRYTQNPERFESQLAAAAPRVAYVQQIAARHNVPGEFALLPWVESQYRPVSGGKNMPAGMWQIMPATASALGIRIDRGFDGRMDVPAATDAIMALLSRYHDDLDDWRLVDYAFNTGEFGLRKMIDKHGLPPAEPVIPRMPVKPVTREHLVKLLAIACVIRDPGRFNVSLPTLPSEERLVTVSINNSMPLAHAASHAGMSQDELKDLNAGFRNGVIDSNASPYLLLPRNRVQQFQNALLAEGNNSPQTIAGTAALPPLNATLGAARDDTSDGPRQQTHTVKNGESLWTIARRYSVAIKQLQRWNNLQTANVKPGQVLKVAGPG